MYKIISLFLYPRDNVHGCLQQLKIFRLSTVSAAARSTCCCVLLFWIARKIAAAGAEPMLRSEANSKAKLGSYHLDIAHAISRIGTVKGDAPCPTCPIRSFM